MSIRLNNLDSYDLDLLKEIGNIGAGNAATALADILQGRVNMEVPRVEILKFNDLVTLLGGAENLVAGILIATNGDIDGYVMFILEDEYASRLIGELLENGKDTALDFDDYEKSALKEVTNIIAGSYLTAISTLTNLKFNMSVPYLAIDMAGAILSVPIASYGTIGESVLIVETEFKTDNKTIIGHFFLIPDFNSYDKLIDVLRIGDQ